MTSALIPPVIPRRSPPGNWPRGRPGAAGPLPLPASPGQAPALAADVVTARRDPDGLAILPPRHYIVIPATLRYRCGLLPGDPVLVAARPAEDTLTAYSLAVVDQALAARIPFPACEGGDR